MRRLAALVLVVALAVIATAVDARPANAVSYAGHGSIEMLDDGPPHLIAAISGGEATAEPAAGPGDSEELPLPSWVLWVIRVVVVLGLVAAGITAVRLLRRD